MFEEMVLNLENRLDYGVADSSFDEIIKSVREMEDGFEALFEYRMINSGDAMTIKLEKAGTGHLIKGPSDSHKIISVRPGRYIFRQLPVPEREEYILKYLLPISQRSSSDILYVRILKENILESVMQLLLPC